MGKRRDDPEGETIFSIRIPLDLLTALREAAEAEDRSTASLIRRICEAYIRDRKGRGR